MIRQIDAMAKTYGDLVPEYVRDVIEQQHRYEMVVDSLASPVVQQLQSFQRQLSGLKGIVGQRETLLESSKRWADALTIVQTKLPERGWYLTGQESSDLTPRLACLAREEKWEEVDSLLVQQASELTVDAEAFCLWLTARAVPECSTKRVCIFLDARERGDHEVATLVGVPLIDEICRYLYGGKDFTSKRKKQPKPQMACSSGMLATRLSGYCEGFVNAFGLIQHDVEPSRCEDEDYFNRSAILHGMMRRSYGPKDSAKTFMTLMFLVFAIDEETESYEELAVDSDVQ